MHESLKPNNPMLFIGKHWWK